MGGASNGSKGISYSVSLNGRCKSSNRRSYKSAGVHFISFTLALTFLTDGTYCSKVTNTYIVIAGKAMVSNTALAWLGNGDVRTRTNSNMFIDPGVQSMYSQCTVNVARRAPHKTVFIYYIGSQSTKEVVFATKQGRYDLSIA